MRLRCEWCQQWIAGNTTGCGDQFGLPAFGILTLIDRNIKGVPTIKKTNNPLVFSARGLFASVERGPSGSSPRGARQGTSSIDEGRSGVDPPSFALVRRFSEEPGSGLTWNHEPFGCSSLSPRGSLGWDDPPAMGRLAAGFIPAVSTPLCHRSIGPARVRDCPSRRFSVAGWEGWYRLGKLVGWLCGR